MENKKILTEEDVLPDAIPEEPIVVSTEVEEEDVPTEVVENSYLTLFNDAISDVWNLVDNFRGIIANVSINKPEWVDIIDIVNGAIDDSIVITGMLSKAAELIDTDTAGQMVKGIEKAEEIIDDKEVVEESLKEELGKYTLRFDYEDSEKSPLADIEVVVGMEGDPLVFTKVPTQEEVKDTLNCIVNHIKDEYSKEMDYEDDVTSHFKNIKIEDSDFNEVQKYDDFDVTYRVVPNLKENYMLREDYSGFLGTYGFDYFRGIGDYEYWYYKDREDLDGFKKAVERIRKEYPDFIVSSGTQQYGRPVIYIQKSKYGKKENFKESKEDTVKTWWNEVEEWNNSIGNKYFIDNSDSTFEEMVVAMYDMLIDLGKETDKVARKLYKKGKMLYNRLYEVGSDIALYTKFNEAVDQNFKAARENFKQAVKQAIDNTGLSADDICLWLLSFDMGTWTDEILDNEDIYERYLVIEDIFEEDKEDAQRLKDTYEEVADDDYIYDFVSKGKLDTFLNEKLEKDFYAPVVLTQAQKEYIVDKVFSKTASAEKIAEYRSRFREPWTLRHYHDFDFYSADEDFPYILDINNQRDNALSRETVEKILLVG